MPRKAKKRAHTQETKDKISAGQIRRYKRERREAKAAIKKAGKSGARSGARA